MWSTCGWYVVSMWLACDWHVVGMWLACGWYVGSVVSMWSACSQHVARHEMWPNKIEFWSDIVWWLTFICSPPWITAEVYKLLSNSFLFCLAVVHFWRLPQMKMKTVRAPQGRRCVERELDQNQRNRKAAQVTELLQLPALHLLTKVQTLIIIITTTTATTTTTTNIYTG